MKNNYKILLIVVIVIILVASVDGATYFTIFNDKNPVSVDYINSANGADVINNNVLKANMEVGNNSNLSSEVINAAKTRNPVIKFGNGEGPVTFIVTGFMEINYLLKLHHYV